MRFSRFISHIATVISPILRTKTHMQKQLLLFSFLLIGMGAWAQPINEKAALEQERKEIQKELNEIQQLFDQVKSQKKQTLGQLNLLNRKIQLQEKYLNSINQIGRAHV